MKVSISTRRIWKQFYERGDIARIRKFAMDELSLNISDVSIRYVFQTWKASDELHEIISKFYIARLNKRTEADKELLNASGKSTNVHFTIK